MNLIESIHVNTTDSNTSNLINEDIKQISINGSNDTSMTFNDTELNHATLSTIPTSSVAVDNLLANNFDRVSIPAITTIIKYIHNLIVNPVDIKFRSINTSNKAFQEKILNVCLIFLFVLIFINDYIY
jgi:hypothetical protein